ncbi:type I polyketide synthase [Streptoalloteichus hindustanus]|uniref:Phthiocerol/phenolphthiocerol synthesis type-I polyketide synthase D n=1 Tax=Streptoalloteichus hindustanus TaxID=2017 RepID=A0A1M4ZFZ2_STRHI|nr:type I polyketide synthase [Streptoalloteichus hindustanus]SHF16707.1 phthiocerol/phenolphthiocerol synthesis type-I polyketide synthase D [Streptoalloteichus hindustanus]
MSGTVSRTGSGTGSGTGITPSTEDEWRSWLVARLGELLGRRVAEGEWDRPLRECGVSSRAAVNLAADIGNLLGREVPHTLLWETPTLAGLARRLSGAGQAGSAQRTPVDPGEPVAVVGLACRFPGAPDAEDFWSLLREGRDAISTVPDGRWEPFLSSRERPELPRLGGFLPDVTGFDADFFGITPREAEAMDPQQRLLLEVAWAALAHAGIPPATLRGTDTGVFVGLSATEFGQWAMADLAAVDAWSSTGAAASLAANRLSYVLGLHGPSMTVDTACSSSLVAVHQAMRALHAGEVSTALVGGVNVLLSPAVTASFHAAGVLSPEGRCKPFDASADGIVRGEGCGVVVLRRLTDARRAGDRVLAVLRGSAVNSDGRSNGITAPNPLAQQRLLRDVYTAAGLSPATVDYVEAHGTGTPLGDPVEAGALAAVLGADRSPERPLLLGSVKSNLGHLEGAAGIAGLIKVVLALRHSLIPASLHVSEPNPRIDLRAGRLRVVTSSTRWPRYSGVARAGVSAFGFGGTNAHVVVEEWPSAARVSEGDSARTPVVIPLSARSEARLRAKAAALARWLGDEWGGRPSPVDLAAALAHGCDDDPVRTAVVAGDRAELRNQLRALADGQRSAPARPAPTTAPVFVLSGHGSQWPAMGRRLLAEEPAFADAVRLLDPDFDQLAGFALSAALAGSHPADELAVQQLALFGTQIALAALWREHGVEPGAVIGHSVGEVAAAVIAGSLDVREGLRVMLARTAVLAEIDAAGAGAMALVEFSPTEMSDLRGDFPDVTIAVYASPAQCTVSGPADQVAALVALAERRGRFARRLAVRGAGHSAAVSPFLDRFRAMLGTLSPRPASVPFYSTVDQSRTPEFGEEYWAANLREPVRFSQAVTAAVRDGHRVFVEISPHPIAASAVERTAHSLGESDIVVLPTMHRYLDDRTDGFLGALATMYELGHAETLRRRYPRRVVVDLPPPVWEHRAHWRPAPVRSRPGHPFLADLVRPPQDERRLRFGDVGLTSHPWLADHSVHGVPVFPGAGFVELTLAMARDLLPESAGLEVRDLVLHRMLPLSERTEVCVQAAPRPGGGFALSVFARSGEDWVLHAEGVTTSAGMSTVELCSQPETRPQQVDLYAALDEAGQVYGPSFRGLTSVVGSAGFAEARVRQPDGSAAYVLHPILGDSCLHALAAAGGGKLAGQLWLPTSFGRVRVFGNPAQGTTVRAWLSTGAGNDGTRSGSVQLLDGDGHVVVDISDVSLQPLRPSEFPVFPHQLAFETKWTNGDLATVDLSDVDSSSRRTWLVLHDNDDTSEDLAVALAKRLTRAGHTTSLAPLVDAVDAPLTERGTERSELEGVVVVAGRPLPPSAVAESRELVLASADAARRLVTSGSSGSRLWLLTRGAAVTTSGDAGSPGLAALRGLVRVLAFEHPETRASWLDLDPAADAVASAEVAARELVADSADDEVAWRSGQRFAHRLARVPAAPATTHLPVRAGAYVISGGLGGLGLATAGWLAEHGATRLVLSGRRKPSPDAETAIDDLRANGTEVEVILGDIAEAGVASGLVARATTDGVPLRGVVHAAGVLADSALLSLRPEDLAAVWRAKTEGALRLHEASAEHDLDWWLAYSSAAALFGSPGQLSYATANAWMDAFVAWLRAEGRPAVSIQWGAWGEIGGATNKDNPLLSPLSTEEGLAALGALLASGRGTTAVTRLDFGQVLDLFPALRGRPFFELASARQPGHSPSPAWDSAELLRLDPRQAREELSRRVTAVVADLMRQDPAALDVRAPLTSRGFDSLLAMRARATIERDFGRTLPLPLLMRGASLTDLCDWLAAELDIPNAPVEPEQPEAPRLLPRDPAERWVARLWRQVLGDADIPVDVPFDTAGGGENERARLRSLVAEEIGRPVRADELFAVPTIAGMADVLRTEINGAGQEPVRLLARGGSGPTLFLFHPAGGPTEVYRPLVRHLPADVRCYGMERLDGCDDVESKAARYLDLLRERQPVGPYRLGGWSFGGCLAYEAARQLVAAGAEVDLLFLIDTILPLPAEGRSPRELSARRMRRFVEHVERSYRVDLDLPEDGLKPLSEDERFALVMRRVRDRVPAITDAVADHQRTSYVDAVVGERYRPGRYSGPVLLFRAARPHPLTTALDPRYLRTDAALGWDEFCQDLEVVPVPGDHISVIDPPHVTVIADRLSAALRPARQPRR